VKLKKKTQTQIRQINKLKHDDIENKIQFYKLIKIQHIKKRRDQIQRKNI